MAKKSKRSKTSHKVKPLYQRLSTQKSLVRTLKTLAALGVGYYALKKTADLAGHGAGHGFDYLYKNNKSFREFMNKHFASDAPY